MEVTNSLLGMRLKLPHRPKNKPRCKDLPSVVKPVACEVMASDDLRHLHHHPMKRMKSSLSLRAKILANQYLL